MTRRSLRASLVGLVALNLLFIQITGVLGWPLLLPLYALTFLAPWLTCFHERPAYHVTWNVAIVGVLGWLVFDARTRGIAFLLDDGMFLAGACQVHLLNNLRERQKPDLTFLNSFLIAIVTSYFCADVQFLLVFVPYAFVLVHAMTVACLQGHDAPVGTKGGWMRGHLVRAGSLLALTTLVFLTWPRSFDRTGFLAGAIDFSNTGGVATPGYTERVVLDRAGARGSSPAVVFRVRHLDGAVGNVPLHWRGGTCSAFDGESWIPEDPPPRAVGLLERRAWAPNGELRWERTLEPPVTRCEVTMERLVAERLFLPETAQRIDMVDGSRPRPDGTIGWRTRRAAGVSFTVDLGREPPGTEPRRIDRQVLERYLILDGGRVPPEFLRLREAWRSEGGPARDPRAHVENLRQRVSNLGPYLAPGDPEASRSLGEFAAGRGGHCEMFASALATFLRLDGIPCRLVTGFLAQEWNADHTELVVRERHAHAWLEVFDVQRGWYAVDPTPAAAGLAGAVEPDLFDRALALLSSAWSVLVGFDAEARAAWSRWFVELPAQLLSLGTRHPFAVAGSALFLGLFVWRRRTRRGEPVAVRAYRAALRRCRVHVRPGETPREVLARAAAREGGDPRTLAALRAATERHERARYAAEVCVSAGTSATAGRPPGRP